MTPHRTVMPRHVTYCGHIMCSYEKSGKLSLNYMSPIFTCSTNDHLNKMVTMLGNNNEIMLDISSDSLSRFVEAINSVI